MKGAAHQDWARKGVPPAYEPVISIIAVCKRETGLSLILYSKNTFLHNSLLYAKLVSKLHIKHN